jgi:hypothetical protein
MIVFKIGRFSIAIARQFVPAMVERTGTALGVIVKNDVKITELTSWLEQLICPYFSCYNDIEGNYWVTKRARSSLRPIPHI